MCQRHCGTVRNGRAGILPKSCVNSRHRVGLSFSSEIAKPMTAEYLCQPALVGDLEWN